MTHLVIRIDRTEQVAEIYRSGKLVTVRDIAPLMERKSMTMGRTFPIQLDPQIPSIPWDLIAPHEAQARANHSGWSLDRLAARGGVMTEEALAIIEDRPWSRMPLGLATRRLQAYVIGGTGTPDDQQTRILTAALAGPPVWDDIAPEQRGWVGGAAVVGPDVLRQLERAIALGHRLRANTPVKHTANELIATLEGVRIMLSGETV